MANNGQRTIGCDTGWPENYGACCHGDQQECSYIPIEDCYNMGGMFIGVGVPCSPYPCSSPPEDEDEGACCLPDESCQFLTSDNCDSFGGTWIGKGILCADTDCDQLSGDEGACCLPDESCQFLTSDDCDSFGGTWRGKGILCGAADCEVFVECAWVEKSQIFPSDVESYDYFGVSVSISGNVAAVGSRGAGEGGAVYVYRFNDTDWVQEGDRLESTSSQDSDQFGYSVSISDDVLIVGVRKGDGNSINSGKAYIYRFIADEWWQEAELFTDDGELNDNFGYSVAISDNWAIVGAKYNNDNGDYSGSAYFYFFNGSSWNELQAFHGPTPGQNFGQSVAISGDTAIVGAYGDDDNGASSGAAYIYELVGGVWQEEPKLTAYDGGIQDYFGGSVSIDGDTAVIGAWQNDNGSVYVYQKLESGWSGIEPKLVADDGENNDNFGDRVAISGDTIVVGAWGVDDNGSQSGSAYIFRFAAGQWNQEDKLIGDNVSEGHQFGSSVGISDFNVIIGAPYDDGSGESEGSIYTYTCENAAGARSADIPEIPEESQLPPPDAPGVKFDEMSKKFTDESNGCDFPLPDGSDFIFNKDGIDSSDNFMNCDRGFAMSDNGKWLACGYSANRTLSSGGTQRMMGTITCDTGWGENYGACCYGDDCSYETILECFNSGGIFIGVGVPCSPPPCDDQPPEVCICETGNICEQKVIQIDDLNGRFGRSVSISGDGTTAIIGAPYEDGGGGGFSGAAYIYKLLGGVWQETARLGANDGDSGDYFGWFVSI